jgi:hypothetical protein
MIEIDLTYETVTYRNVIDVLENNGYRVGRDYTFGFLSTKRLFITPRVGSEPLELLAMMHWKHVTCV